MKTCKINVLGTWYTVHLLDEQTVEMAQKNWGGYCDSVEKEIYVLNHRAAHKTLIHEITHAFLFESGIELYSGIHTEEMVEWVAWQLNNIYNTVFKAQMELDKQEEDEDED